MPKTKLCVQCATSVSVAYRVQYSSEKKWVFLCKECVLKVKPKNQDYRYGGTWKGK